MRRTTTSLAALGLALAAAGCGHGGARLAPQADAATSAASGASAGPTAGATGGPTTTDTSSAGSAAGLDATLSHDTDGAVSAVDAYWKAHWSDFFQGNYSPPRVEGYYDSGRTIDPAFSCGGQPADAQNARYCPADDTLAWDVQLMRKGEKEGGGNAFVYLVVAHEWGHAIANRLSPTLQAAPEPQADCLAGAVIYGSAKDGVIQFEQGDEKTLSSSLVNLADDTPWTNVNDHGSAFQRIENFDAGRQGGVRACLPRDDGGAMAPPGGPAPDVPGGPSTNGGGVLNGDTGTGTG